MTLAQRLQHELRAVLLLTLYFACWLGALMGVKHLVLEQYSIDAGGWSMALVGALILSKVVLVLEKVPLGPWVAARPAWVDVVVRTALYTLGVAVVLVPERAFEGRGAHGGFGPSLHAALVPAGTPHVVLNTLVIGGALPVFNALEVVRAHLPGSALVPLFLLPRPRGS